jgi:hypothetical protein
LDLLAFLVISFFDGNLAKSFSDLVFSTSVVFRGEELTVLYGYDMDWCPDWYRDAWQQGPDSFKKKKINILISVSGDLSNDVQRIMTVKYPLLSDFQAVTE